MCRTRSVLLLAASAAMGVSSNLFADRITWTNGANNGLWDDPLNWSSGVPTAVDEAYFPVETQSVEIPVGQTRQVARFGPYGRFGGGRLETNDVWGVPLVSSDLGALGSWLHLGGASPASSGIRPKVRGTIGDGAGGGSFGVYGAMQLFNDATHLGETVAIGTMELRSEPFTGRQGRLVSTPRIYVPRSSTLYAMSSVTNSVDRIPDSAEINLHGGTLHFENDGAERMGKVMLGSGLSRFGSSFVDFTASALERVEGTLNSELQHPMKLLNPPVLGPAPGPTQRPILPYAVGFSTTFMTYDAGTDPVDPTDDVGMRPLDPVTEHTTSLAAGGNVRVASGTLTTDTTIKSLTLTGPVALNNARLTLTSNALLLTDSGRLTGSGTISFPEHAFVWTRPYGILNPYGSNSVGVALSAPSMTISAPTGVIFGKSNSIPGGIHLVDGYLVSAADGAYGGGTITMTGGGFVANTVAQTIRDVVLDGVFAQGPATVTTPADLGAFQAPSLTLTGGIWGRGEVRVFGNVRVNGDSQVENLKIVLTGGSPLGTDLRVNGMILPQPGGRLELEQSLSSTLITGNGLFGGTIHSTAGAIAPGPGPARLTIRELLLDGDSHPTSTRPSVQIELNGLEPGISYDQLVVTVGLTIDFARMEALVGFDPLHGDSFHIFDNQFLAPVVGTFEGLPQGATFMAGGYELMIDYLGGDGNDIVLTVVPEPSLLLAAALASLILRRGRRTVCER